MKKIIVRKIKTHPMVSKMSTDWFEKQKMPKKVHFHLRICAWVTVTYWACVKVNYKESNTHAQKTEVINMQKGTYLKQISTPM